MTEMPTPETLEFAWLASTGSAPVLGPADGVVQPELARGDAPLGLRTFRDRLTPPPLIQAWRRPADKPLRIAARTAQVRAHADLPTVTGWTYEGSQPGPTIEVRRGRPVLIDWVNDVADDAHHAARLPFDVVRVPLLASGAPDFAAAAAPGGRSIRRGEGPDSYPPLDGTEVLTAATVVHVHGALTDGHNDGWAHNVATLGHTTRCTYPNDQPAATLWYHDHAMAVTRFNVHAGLAGFYWIRDEVEDALLLPSGRHELALVLADRNLETLPASAQAPGAAPAFTGRFLYKHAAFSFGPGTPLGEIPVTGPFNAVNGTIWPTHDVSARWHRLRIVNGAGARIYRLALHDTTDENLPPGAAIPAGDPAFAANRLTDALVVIGTDGGLLPAPSVPDDGTIELGPGERLDVLVDFGRLRGRTLELRNENGSALNAIPGQADATVMRFVVSRHRAVDRFRLPAVLNPEYRCYELAHVEQAHDEQVWVGVVPPGVRGGLHPEMWELGPVGEGAELSAADVIQIEQSDGSVLSLHPVAKLFDDTTSIFLAEGQWALWNLLHLGGPDHPMHIHMTEFQILSRRAWTVPRPGGTVAEFELGTGRTTRPLPEPGPGRPIDAVTAGMKDTWVLKAGEWVQVLGHFAGATGSFMYHCHILDHEDHTMMRPFVVLPREILAFHRGHSGGHH